MPNQMIRLSPPSNYDEETPAQIIIVQPSDLPAVVQRLLPSVPEVVREVTAIAHRHGATIHIHERLTIIED